MTSDLSFDQLVGMSAREFLLEHRHRAPLVTAKAVPDVAERVLSMSDLDDLLAAEAVHPPYVHVTRGGTRRHESLYTRPARVASDTVSNATDPARIVEEFRSGSTITFAAAQTYQWKLRRLCRVVEGVMRSQIEALVFATPPGMQGFTRHTDGTEVFAIQVQGTKRWNVWAPLAERPDQGGGVEDARLGDPLVDVVMHPGDCLYIPWGSPHMAVPEDGLAVHVSVTAKPVRWSAVLAEYIRTTLLADVPLAAEPPVLNPVVGDRLEAELEAVVGALRERLGALDVPAAVAGLTAAASAPVGFDERYFRTVAWADDDLPQEAELWRDPEIGFSIVEIGDGRVDVQIGPRTFALPAAAADALQLVARAGSTGRVTVAQLGAGLSQENALRLVRHLIRSGLLAPRPWRSAADAQR